MSVSIEGLALSRDLAAKHVGNLGYDANDFAARLIAELVGQGAMGVQGTARDVEPSAPSFSLPGFARSFEHVR